MARFTYYGGSCVCSRDECSEDCATYRSYKPKAITNADRIRAMTDEELAELLNPTASCTDCLVYNRKPCGTDGRSCRDRILDWLRQEAVDDQR